jgi:hypothetical protein
MLTSYRAEYSSELKSYWLHPMPQTIRGSQKGAGRNKACAFRAKEAEFRASKGGFHV